jgi:hypothetical protein
LIGKYGAPDCERSQSREHERGIDREMEREFA